MLKSSYLLSGGRISQESSKVLSLSSTMERPTAHAEFLSSRAVSKSMAANVAMKTHKCGYENTIVISLRGRLPRAEERDPRTPLVGADPSKRQLWSLQVRQTVPTRRVGWVFSNEDSNLRMSPWGSTTNAEAMLAFLT